MKPVVNYLENLTKSMSYAAIDVSKEIMPNVGDFLDSNSGFLKATYATLRNPKMALRKSVTAIQESKIYQAVEYGAKNAFEDLRTGNFYNKERDDRDSIKMAGMNADFDDMSAYGIDDDWESQLNEKPTKKNEVTAGDLQITEAIEKTSSANASATVNAVVASAEYNAKITKATAGNLYLQNERLFGGLHQDLTVVGKTMDSIQNITSTALQNMDKNQSDFFTSQTKLSQERNAMLKELLEMQRNVYKSAVDKEKEDRSKDKKKNNRWEDVQFGGMVDFEAYKEVVMNNINNQIAGLGIPTLGNENSNMIAAFMTSPLKSITTGLIHGLIPAATKVAAKNLDESLSGIFGNIIAEFSRMRNSDNKIAQAIGNIFGVNTSVDKSITTNRYEKGPIPFDGITRKSIIEVIPGYLRRIEAFLSGSNERVYNYETGSWTTIENLKQELRAKDKQYMKNATRDFMKAMDNFDPITHSTDYNTMKEMKDAVEELQIYMYNHGQALNTKRTAEQNGISMSNYPNLYKHYNAIIEFMKARQEGGKVITRNNNMKSVDMVTKEFITAANKIADTKSSQHRFFRSIEDDVTNPYRVIYEDSFTGNHLKSTTPYAKIGDKDTVIHEVRQNTDSSGSGYDNNFNYGHLLFVKDNLGNTLYDYLQNINNEAIWWRETAFSTIALRLNSINNNIGGPVRVVGINDNTPPVTPPSTEDNNTPPSSNNSSTTSNSNNNPPPPPNNNISTVLMAESIEDITKITSRNPNFYKDRVDALKNERKKRAEARIKEIEEQKKQKDIDKAIEFLNKRKGIDLQHVNDEEINLQQLPDLIKLLVELNADSEGRKYIAAHTQETNLNFFTENLNKLSVQDFPKTIEEVQKLLEDEEKKEEKESEKEEEKEKDDDEKEKTFMEKMGDRIKKGATVVGGFIGATGEVFENLANTATRGIYDMLFRHKIKLRKDEDEDDEDENEIDYTDGKYHGENVRDSDLETNEDDKKRTEFEGIMDLMGYKIRRTFKGVRSYIKNSVINPIKKWLGKELDDEEDNPLKDFKDTLLEYGKNFIDSFLEANSDIWGKTGKKIVEAVGITGEENIAQKSRRKARQQNLKDLEYIKTADINDLISQDSSASYVNYGGNLDAYRQNLIRAKIQQYLNNTNNITEFYNPQEINSTFLPMLNELDVTELKDIARKCKIKYTEKSTREELIKDITEYTMYNKNFNFADAAYNKLEAKRKRRISLASSMLSDEELYNFANKYNITTFDVNTGNRLSSNIIRNNISERVKNSSRNDKNIFNLFKDSAEVINKNKQIFESYINTDNNDKIKESVKMVDPDFEKLSTSGKIDQLIKMKVIEKNNPQITAIITDNTMNGDQKEQTLHNLLNKLYLQNFNAQNFAFGTNAYKTGEAYVTAGEKRISKNGDIKTIARSGKTFLYDEAIIPKENKSYQAKLNDLGHERGLAAINGEKVTDNPYVPNFGRGSSSRRRHRGQSSRRRQLAAQRGQITNEQELENIETVSETIIEEATEIASEAATTVTAQSISTSTENTDSVTISGKRITSKDLIAQAKSHIGEMGAGSVVGGIASMLLGLVGGPLAGAAIGAGAALVHKSEFLQEKLFGAKGEDNKRQGGIISKEVVNAVQKYAPDMFKYSLAGIIPGLITGFGPIPGILVGGTIGYLKNNEDFTNKYFGEHGKLTLGTKEKQIIQDMLPGAAKGAIGGIIKNLVFGGPFGMVGSMLIGSAIGMMASTNDFKSLLLGVADNNGNREGGLLGMIKDTFNPIAEAAIEFKDKLLNTLVDNIIEPLSQFAVPFIHELPKLVMWLPNKINDFFDKRFGRSLTGLLKDFVVKPATGLITKLVAPVTNTVLKVVTSPVKLLGVAGKGIRKKQIREHRADYMTAAERMEWSAKNGGVINDYDKVLASIGSEGGMSLDNAKQLSSLLQITNDSKAGLQNLINDTKKDINDIIGSFSVDGHGLSKKTQKKVREALKAGNIKEATNVLTSSPLEGTKRTLSKDEIDSLLKNKDLNNKMQKYINLNDRLKAVKEYTDDDKNDARNQLNDLFKKLGLNGLDASNEKQMKQLLGNLNTEIEDREANGTDNEKENVDHIVDNTDEISENIKAIRDLVLGYATGNTEGMQKEAQKVKDSIAERETVINQHAKDREAKIESIIGKQEYEKDLNKRKEEYKQYKEDYEKRKKEAEEKGETFTEELKVFHKDTRAERLARIQELGKQEYSKIKYKTDADGNIIKDENGNFIRNENTIDMVNEMESGKAKSPVDALIVGTNNLVRGSIELVTNTGIKFTEGVVAAATGTAHGVTNLGNVLTGMLENATSQIPLLAELTTSVNEIMTIINTATANVNDSAQELKKETKSTEAIHNTLYNFQKSGGIVNDEGAKLNIANKEIIKTFGKEIYNYGENNENLSLGAKRALEIKSKYKIGINVVKEINNYSEEDWKNIKNFIMRDQKLLDITDLGGLRNFNKFEISLEDMRFLKGLNAAQRSQLSKLAFRAFRQGLRIDSFGNSLKNLYEGNIVNQNQEESSENITEVETENPESIETNTEEPTSAAFGTVPNYALGTVLSGLATAGKFIGKTALNIGKGAVKLAWKGVKGATKLAWKGAKGLAKSAVNSVSRLIPSGIKNLAGALTDKITDMASNVKNSIKNKAGKFQELINLGNGKLAIFKGKRDKDGNIKDIDADTTNADTREAMNQLEEEKKQQEDANNAQINTGNAVQEMINPSDNKASTAVNFIGTILKAIAIGGVVALLWEPIIKPIITKVWDGFVKPVGSWVLNTAIPWMNKEIFIPLIQKLPTIIYNSINGIKDDNNPFTSEEYNPKNIVIDEKDNTIKMGDETLSQKEFDKKFSLDGVSSAWINFNRVGGRTWAERAAYQRDHSNTDYILERAEQQLVLDGNIRAAIRNGATVDEIVSTINSSNAQKIGDGLLPMAKDALITREEVQKWFDKYSEYELDSGTGNDNIIKPLSKYGRYKETNNFNYDIINDDTIDTTFNESSAISTIEAAKEGRISIFSSEYWNNNGNSELSNAYSKAMKIMAIPSIVIRNSMRYFLEDASEFTKQFSKLGSSNYVTSTDAFDPSAGAQFLNGTGKYGKGKYVKQIDPSVANIGFNTGIDSEYQTIGDSGCGPAAAVNAIQSMYGRSKSLINAAKFALKNGYKEKNGGTKPGFFKNYFASKGLKSQTTNNKNTLASNIRAGIPTVLMGQDKKGVSSSTPYGRNPHYVTATGVDSKGRVIIQDPESRYDNQLYSMDDVINKTSFGVSAYGRSKMDNIFSLFMNVLNNSNAGKVFSSLLGNKYGKGKYDAEVWNYLKNNMGFTDAGAAGVIGNMNQESNVDPGNLSDSIKSISDEDFTKGVDNGSITKQQFITGDGTKFSHYNGDYGYGLVQWYAKDVKEWLYDYIKSKNLSIGDLTGQLEFLKYDTTDLRKSRYADMINTLKTTNDPSKAAASFLKIYEVSGEEPGDPGYDNRIKYAKEVYDKLKGTTGTAISDSETATSSKESDNSTSDYLNIFDMLKNVLNNSNAGKVFNSLLGISSDSSNSSSSTSASSNGSNGIKVNSNATLNKSGSAQAVIENAISQIGRVADPNSRYNKYNAWWNEGQYNGEEKNVYPGPWAHWCANFVSWIMRHSGVSTDTVPNYAIVDYNAIKSKGAKDIAAQNVLPGDIMITNGESHTGIVAGYRDGKVYIIDGNGDNSGENVNFQVDYGSNVNHYLRPPYSKDASRLDVNSVLDTAQAKQNIMFGNGTNECKPLSKYGKYKESLSYEDRYNEIIEMKKREYDHDQYIKKQSVYSRYGKGTNETKDNTHLINTIITILYTIADNTDKLNMIVSILNDKLGIKIEPKDINSNVNRETLKQRIMKSLNNTPNLISATSKINGFADDADNGGVLSVINAMNIIASE